MTSTNVFNLQIDSNYRDVSQYPLATDFAVRFNTTADDGQQVSGLPIDNNFNLFCLSASFL